MKEFDKFLQIIEKLRSDEGCPWDREQTISSLKTDLIDEVKEVIEAIDKEDYENLKEEIGDLIWVVALLTQIAKEDEMFEMKDVLQNVIQKIKHRHPHVFGGVKAVNSDEAKKFFNEAKLKEKEIGY